MRFKPTPTGGRIAEGKTPFGDYRAEWDADGKLVAESCELRDPAKSRGLGDTIAQATKAIGIKPCGGCKKRQAKLNATVPYK